VQRQAYIYAATAVLLWATIASAFKISLRYLDSLQLLFYASVVSTLVLFVILLFQRKLPLLREFSKRDYIRSAWLGLLNPFLYYIVLFTAYSRLPAQEAQPLNWTWPITLSILSIPLLKQRMALSGLLALLISFAGVLVISTRGDILGLHFSNPVGGSLALGSSVIWAVYWIYNVKDQRDDVAKLFLNFAFGTIFVIILVIVTSKTTLPGAKGILGAIYVGLFEMGITFVVWLKALKLSRTTAQVSNFIYATPFISLIVINFAVGEHIRLSSIVGLLLIISGILLQQHVEHARPDLDSARKNKEILTSTPK
jgi:drug/metabolite transporter (DMT)-like permease